MNSKKSFNLSQYFSIASYIQLTSEIVLPSETAKRSRWVISRALCLYELVDLRNIPKDEQKNALSFEVKKRSPYKNTGYYVHFNQGFAMVWLWDKSKVQAAIDEQAVEIFEVVPETLLRPAVNQNGLVLSSTLDDGFDLQWWHAEVLIASCWFANAPTEQMVKVFLQGTPWISNFTPDSSELAEPLVINTPLSSTVWEGREKGGHFKGFNLEPIFVLLLLFSALGFLQWQLISYWKATSTLAEVEESIDTAIQQVTPISEAREKALLNQAETAQTYQLLKTADPLLLLTVFGEKIQQLNGQLVGWTLNNDQLEITLESESSDALKFVSHIQELSMVESVTTEPARQNSQIKLAIKLSL